MPRRTLEFVAAVTGKAKINKLRRPSLAPGKDVIDNHRIAGIRLCCLTIGAAMIVSFQQLPAEFYREVGAHAMLQLIGGRNDMASPV